jgi:hypothetical protein
MVRSRSGDGNTQEGIDADYDSLSPGRRLATPASTGAIPKTSNLGRIPAGDGTVPAGSSISSSTSTPAPIFYESGTNTFTSPQAGNEKFRQSCKKLDALPPSQRCHRYTKNLMRYMLHVYKKHTRDDHAGVQRSVDRLKDYFKRIANDIIGMETAAKILGRQECELFKVTSHDLRIKTEDIRRTMEKWGYNV